MSWAEVQKFNECARQNTINGALVIENSKTWTAPKTGYYKIIVVGGAGHNRKNNSASSPNVAGGGAGGVAIKTMKIMAGTAYVITIDTTSSDNFTATSFGTEIVANSGTAGTLSGANANPIAGVGGTATGGDYNYKGENGATSTNGTLQGASVGCFIPGITDRQEFVYQTEYDGDATSTHLFSGYGILGHGGCYSLDTVYYPNDRQTGCVVIIPLGGI